MDKKILIGAAVVLALAIGAGLYFAKGCGGPTIDPTPSPVVGHLKKLILVRESGQQSDALARLVESLQGGKGEKWLAEKGIELVGVIDPGDTDSANESCRMVKQWLSAFDGKPLPLVLLVDENDKLIRQESLPESVTLENFVTLCTEHQEQAFADLPYVDADFQSWPQHGTGDNSDVDTFEVRRTNEDKPAGDEPSFGQISPTGPPEPSFEDAIPLIPRDQWPACIKAIDDNGGSLDLLVTRIYNQGQEGSCVSNATCQSMEIAQAIRRGKKSVIPLSAISLYKRVGSSPRSGSMVSSNLREILGRGVLPLKNDANDKLFAHTMTNTGFYQKYPADWEKTAIRFRGHEVFDVRSYDGFITALLRGYPVVYGRSGHSICAVRPVFKNGRLFVKYANSWGDWGENGFGYDSESTIRSAGWAFALRTVVDPGVASVNDNAVDLVNVALRSHACPCGPDCQCKDCDCNSYALAP